MILGTPHEEDARTLTAFFSEDGVQMVVVLKHNANYVTVLKRSGYHPHETLRKINRNFGEKIAEYHNYSEYRINLSLDELLAELVGSEFVQYSVIPV